MPEGPSIVIMQEEMQTFIGKKILEASGTAPIDMNKLLNRKLVDLKTWGKHFLICLPQVTLRIHLLLFGKYSIDTPRNGKPKLMLRFTNGTLYFYACAVTLLEDDLDDVYEWTTDLMHKRWDPAAARKKLRSHPDMLICDALLNQDIFAGAGNIFKNEVLFRTRIHPLSTVGGIPTNKRAAIVREMHTYAFEFLRWKKAGVLQKHWEAHTKKTCPRCGIPFHKAYLGKTKRRTFYCESCQVRYA